MLSAAAVTTLTAISATGFFGLGEILKLTPPSEDHVKKSKLHKWRNEVVSLCHSAFTGVAAMYCLIHMMMEGKGSTSFFRAVGVVGSISSGYFVCDVIDLLKYDPPMKVLGLMVHHVGMVGCYFMTYITARYYVLAVFAMLANSSSVFLHVRMLLIMHGFNKDSVAFRTNAIVNIVAFVTLRLGIILFILASVLLADYYGLSTFATYTTATFVAALFAVNVVLLKRLVISDFGPRRGGPSCHNAHDADIFGN